MQGRPVFTSPLNEDTNDKTALYQLHLSLPFGCGLQSFFFDFVSLDLYVLFTLGEGKASFLFRGLADHYAPDPFVMIPPQLHIVSSIVKDIQVGMLRVGNSHTLHIFACEFGHKSVCEPRCIVLVKRKGDMFHDFAE